jgi:hypothetical protein
MSTITIKPKHWDRPDHRWTITVSLPPNATEVAKRQHISWALRDWATDLDLDPAGTSYTLVQ